MPSATITLIRLHLETSGLTEQVDFRLHTQPSGLVLLSFSTEATANLLTVHGSLDKLLTFITTVPGLPLAAKNVHLNLQMQLEEQ